MKTKLEIETIELYKHLKKRKLKLGEILILFKKFIKGIEKSIQEDKEHGN